MHLAVPAWEQEVIRHLHSYAESTSLSAAWMLRVLNPAAVIPMLMSLSGVRPADGRLTIESDGSVFTVRVKDGECTVIPGGEPDLRLTPGELAALLFDPFPAEDRPAAPAGWFPLPFSFSTPDEF